jgi:hypothetical protein
MGKRSLALKAFCTNIHELIELAHSFKKLGNQRLVDYLKTKPGKSLLTRLKSIKVGLRFIPNTYMMTSFLEEISKKAPNSEKTIKQLILDRDDSYFCTNDYVTTLVDDKDLKKYLVDVLQISTSEERQAVLNYMIAFVEQSELYLEGIKK